MNVHFLNLPNDVDFIQSLPFAYFQAYLSKFPFFSNLVMSQSSFHIKASAAPVVEHILAHEPDVLAASCYVWNREKVMQVIRQVKKNKPEITVILGGPEFHAGSIQVIEKEPAVDFIVLGEGELPFKEIIATLLSGDALENLDPMPGIIYRAGKQVKLTGDGEIVKELDTIPSPFQGGFYDLSTPGQSVVQYETQRGCLYKCDFCVAGAAKNKVRYFNLESVLRDLDRIFASSPRSIRFFDPAFNSNRARAKTILSHIIDIKNRTGSKALLEFDIIPELLDDELIDLLVLADVESVSFGIQTLNKETLANVNRKRNDSKLFSVIESSLQKKLPVNLQIIYGLPGDTLDSFLQTFDIMYDIPAQSMEVLRAKYYPGTVMNSKAKEFGVSHLSGMPYSIVSSDSLSQSDLHTLDRLAKVRKLTRHMRAGISALCSSLNIPPHRFFLDFIETGFQDDLPTGQALDDIAKVNSAIENLKRFYTYCTDCYTEKQWEQFPQIRQDLFGSYKQMLFNLGAKGLAVQAEKGRLLQNSGSGDSLNGMAV